MPGHKMGMGGGDSAHLSSRLNDDGLSGATDRGVQPAPPLVLVVLINQQHLVPLTALALVNGETVAEIKRANEIIIIIIIKAAALLDKHALRHLDLDTIHQQMD